MNRSDSLSKCDYYTTCLVSQVYNKCDNKNLMNKQYIIRGSNEIYFLYN